MNIEKIVYILCFIAIISSYIYRVTLENYVKIDIEKERTRQIELQNNLNLELARIAKRI